MFSGRTDYGLQGKQRSNLIGLVVKVKHVRQLQKWAELLVAISNDSVNRLLARSMVHCHQVMDVMESIVDSL